METEFFDRLNRQWKSKKPAGSDNIRVYIKPDRCSEDPIGTLHSAKFRTADGTTKGIEHLRAVIYNPRADNIFVIREGEREPLVDVYRGNAIALILIFTATNQVAGTMLPDK